MDLVDIVDMVDIDMVDIDMVDTYMVHMDMVEIDMMHMDIVHWTWWTWVWFNVQNQILALFTWSSLITPINVNDNHLALINRPCKACPPTTHR